MRGRKAGGTREMKLSVFERRAVNRLATSGVTNLPLCNKKQLMAPSTHSLTWNMNAHSISLLFVYPSFVGTFGRAVFHNSNSCGRCSFTKLGPKHINEPIKIHATWLWTLAIGSSLLELDFMSEVDRENTRALSSKETSSGRVGITLSKAARPCA